MFHFPGLAPTSLCIQDKGLSLQLRGLPHSDIFGSKPVCGSPKLFAAYHVLHRLLMPRHPPHALTSLTFKMLLLLSSYYYQGVLINLILTLSLNVIVVSSTYSNCQRTKTCWGAVCRAQCFALEAFHAPKLVIESIKEQLTGEPDIYHSRRAEY